MVNLNTKYLGLELKNPLIASASSLSKKIENIIKLEDVGIGGIVLYSLFEEELLHETLAMDYYLTRGSDSYAEALTYFPELDNYNSGSDKYLELITKAKERVSIPIIASLNGISGGEWTKYAKLIEQAGADALELNIYFVPTDLDVISSELEKSYINLVQEVSKELKIPISVKLSPFFSSLPNFALNLFLAGSKGLVLFNRFYQPDLNIEDLSVQPTLNLSSSDDLLLPLRWTAILYEKVKADIALSSGVHSGKDIVKAIMAGASVAMTASELIKNGISSVKTMLLGFSNWLDVHEYESVNSLRGILSQSSIANPAAFERANYMKALTIFDNKV
jgi:dihydroorotate dehydrogenase (fumarate)